MRADRSTVASGQPRVVVITADEGFEETVRATFIAGAQIHCDVVKGKLSGFNQINIDGANVVVADVDGADETELQALEELMTRIGNWPPVVVVTPNFDRAVARRLARFGKYWIPWGPDARDIAAGIGRMRAAVEHAGGDPDGFGVTGTLRVKAGPDGRPDLTAAAAVAVSQAEAGVTDLRMTHWPLPAGDRERDIPALVDAVRTATEG